MVLSLPFPTLFPRSSLETIVLGHAVGDDGPSLVPELLNELFDSIVLLRLRWKYSLFPGSAVSHNKIGGYNFNYRFRINAFIGCF